MDARVPADAGLALSAAGWIRSLVSSLVRDPYAAEDVVQETWLIALRAAKRPGRPRAWLAGVARILSQRRFRRPDVPAAGLLEEVRDHARTPDELLERADFQRRVLAVVTGLEEPYRTTVLLRYFEGLSVEESSRRMGVSGSTGRTRLQRAHALLREKLDGEYGDQKAWSALACTLTGRAGPSWAEIATMGTQMKVLLGCGVAAVIAWATWELREEPVRPAQAGATTTEEPSDSASSIPDPDVARDSQTTAHAAAERVVLPGSAPPPGDSLVPDESERSQRLIERLRAALERSVSERFDPNAVLDAALYLVEHEASDRAVPEPDPSGWLEFPILDLPDGISAVLKVAPPSNNPEFARIVGIEMEVPKGEPVYLVDGMPRRSARASVTVWADHEDRLLSLSIRSDLDVDGVAARQRGLLESLTFTRGLKYYEDLGDPSKTAMHVTEWKDGKGPIRRDIPLLLEGGSPPRDGIERFGKRLLEMYAGIRAAGR